MEGNTWNIEERETISIMLIAKLPRRKKEAFERQ